MRYSEVIDKLLSGGKVKSGMFMCLCYEIKGDEIGYVHVYDGFLPHGPSVQEMLRTDWEVVAEKCEDEYRIVEYKNTRSCPITARRCIKCDTIDPTEFSHVKSIKKKITVWRPYLYEDTGGIRDNRKDDRFDWIYAKSNWGGVKILSWDSQEIEVEE